MLRAVHGIAAQAGINLTTGTWNGTITRGQKFRWADELGGSYTPPAAPTAADTRLQDKVTTGRLDALSVTGNATAQTFISDLQAIQTACTR